MSETNSMENTLRWHILNCNASPDTGSKVKEGLRAGKRRWRSDIYVNADGEVWAFWYDGDLNTDDGVIITNSGYSRSYTFPTVFDAMRWAQEQYDLYLDPPHEMDDEEARYGND